ncbi:stage III sporulation protein AD [Paenibacillus turpanensis]|uniref:stage III sporulation protein AD n=1 Tax=Paenibacillus turpanensis TaxID=2689078 RepID=UPI00140E247A|nr:stage III sporulation protein AD [Paenibacillus turpanensis]
MQIIEIVGLALIATVLTLVIKEQKPMFAFLLATFTGMVIFLLLLGNISNIMRVLEGLAQKSGVNMVYLKTILKIIGIAYIAEFGAQIVRDAGQESIASKVELAGKILIMAMALPIITVILETVLKLLPA